MVVEIISKNVGNITLKPKSFTHSISFSVASIYFYTTVTVLFFEIITNINITNSFVYKPGLTGSNIAGWPGNCFPKGAQTDVFKGRETNAFTRSVG